MAIQSGNKSDPFDSAEMARRGRAGGLARAAKYGPEELTGKARAAFLKRFDPEDPLLSPEERQRLAQAALRAHMSELGQKSGKRRKARIEEKEPMVDP